ncbi:MAG: MFS transporter [Polaromonas sp.]
MCVGVMGTALASPLYPLYQALWQLQPSDITVIFVAYMLGVLASLLFLGRLTDRFGFLPVLRSGLILVTGGVLLSALAWNVASFMVSRIAIGIASGLITTSAMIGLTQLSRGADPRRASLVTTCVMSLGFGLGPVVGGLIAQFAPLPLLSAYLPTLLMGLLAIYALFQIKVPPRAVRPTEAMVGTPAGISWLPRITFPPRALRRPFWIGCMGAFSAFGVFSLYAALAPTFMQHIVPWHGPAISGFSIGVILFLSTAFQLLARRFSTKTSAMMGLLGLSACNLLLILTSYTGAVTLFVLSVLVTGFGHGVMSMAGMSIVNKVATHEQRAGLLSSYMIVGYLGTIVPILGVGWLANHVGLTSAIVSFCAVMALLTAGLAYAAQKTPVISLPDTRSR